MKEREPRYRDLAARVLSRKDRTILTATSAAMAGAAATASTTGVRPMRSSSVSGTIQARARKQKRR